MDRDELREELLAVLAANRELPGDADEALVESLLAKMSATTPRRSQLADLQEIYERLIPLKPLTVGAIAGAQGIVMVLLGDYLLKRVLDYSYYMDGYMQAWMVFGAMWLAEVIVTIAVLSVLSPARGEGRPRTRTRRLPLS